MSEVARIRPSRLAGTVRIPPSKSAAHRAILCAALADGVTNIAPVSRSKDMEATVRAVRALGGAAEYTGDTLAVRGISRTALVPRTVDCGESGSTLRFLIPIAAALGVPVTLTGSGLLPQRPNDVLLKAMAPHGVRWKGRGLPLQLEGTLCAGTFTLPGNISSQYITGLLFALPLLDGDSRIVLSSPLESRGYVDLTIQVLAQFGVRVEAAQDGYFVPGRQAYRSRAAYRVESDWSQAAFFLSAGALGSDLVLKGLSLDSVQGDRAALALFQRMGADVIANREEIRVRAGRLRPVEIDARQIPDLVPALAATLAFAEGVSRITGAERLRLKESDRIESTVRGLRAIGCRAEATPDGMVIPGVADTPNTSEQDMVITGYNDHRIVMAFAMAGLRLGGLRITDAGSVAKSYPDFFSVYNQLGGNADVIRMGE
ncbi:MAG: 3-phosphoshikimate 1-carboxyvinyltransferase [Clostridiales bacterium]|nr:3-phosphoshikimate 1-carboxyvinyltransferase [Clostridiales bacterium]